MTATATVQLPRQRGTTLLEVLVTVVLLAFGLLGIAAFQAKAQVGSMEAYQRAQALVLLEDMQARMLSNAAAMTTYVTGTNALGVGDTSSGDCTGLTGADLDKCQWSSALKGAAEKLSTEQIGAMTGARGCIEQIQAANPADGVCQPGIYLITVAWQGMHPTVASSLACGKDAYGADTNRRAIAARVSVGTPTCRMLAAGAPAT